MQMYPTAKVDIPEYFRSELSQFMSAISRNISQDIQNRVEQCEVRNTPLYFPIYSQMYTNPKKNPGPSLPWNGPGLLGWKIVFATI